jgi:hypothetical protein
MTVDIQTLDSAFAKVESFGPDLGMPKIERLKKEFPRLSDKERDEILRHVEPVSNTVWALAERGGEAKMKRDEIKAELQAAHPFLVDAGLKQAMFLVNYFAWHEGYDK